MIIAIKLLCRMHYLLTILIFNSRTTVFLINHFNAFLVYAWFKIAVIQFLLILDLFGRSFSQLKLITILHESTTQSLLISTLHFRLLKLINHYWLAFPYDHFLLIDIKSIIMKICRLILIITFIHPFLNE